MQTLAIFDEIATMGSESTIAKMRTHLLTEVEGEKTRFYATNSLRNPFRVSF
jgi:hypothetical protein